MSAPVKKLALTAHVTSSVGWLGAVGVFLAMALAGLFSRRAELVRAAYIAMELVGWFVIVPLCLASFLSGLVQSLGTSWGLFRHYWTTAKFFITVVATVILLIHMRPIGHVADVAAASELSHADLRGLRIQLIADAAAALVALFIATVLSVYKPEGLTPYGKRQATGGTEVQQARSLGKAPLWVKISLALVLLLAVAFLVRHLGQGGPWTHMHRLMTQPWKTLNFHVA